MRKVAVYEKKEKEKVLYEGTFHCFMNVSQDLGFMYASYPSVIVEKEDGSLEAVWIEKVRFLEKA